MANHAVNRRQFLMSLCTIPAITNLPAKSESLLVGVTKPEFWFGDSVDFWWNDETTGDRHSETGEVVGVVWNDADKVWEYSVIWLKSTAYSQEDYPICDGQLVTAGVICKH
jgi:hypothetical protein